MAGVGHQGPLPGQRTLEPGEQLIHGGGERGDLVPGPRHPDLRGRVPGRDGGHLAPHPLDRGQRGAGEPVPAQPGGGHEDDPADQQFPGDIAAGPGIGLQRDAGRGDPAGMPGQRRRPHSLQFPLVIAGDHDLAVPRLAELAEAEHRGGTRIRAGAAHPAGRVDHLNHELAGERRGGPVLARRPAGGRQVLGRPAQLGLELRVDGAQQRRRQGGREEPAAQGEQNRGREGEHGGEPEPDGHGYASSCRSRYPMPRTVSMSCRPNGSSTFRRRYFTYWSTTLEVPS